LIEIILNHQLIQINLLHLEIQLILQIQQHTKKLQWPIININTVQFLIYVLMILELYHTLFCRGMLWNLCDVFWWAIFVD